LTRRTLEVSMNKRLFRSFLILAVAVFPLLGNAFLPKEYRHCRVAKVIDGDTIQLTDGQLVRYIGIDCPEYRRKTADGWKEAPEPFAVQAKRLNEALVTGKELRLEFDVQRKDKYDRLLAYCFVKEKGEGEVMVQAQLLEKGLAYLYTFPPNVKYVDWLVSALKIARQKKRGIWSVDLTIDSKEARRFIGQRKMAVGFVKRTRSTESLVRLEMDGLPIVIFKNDLRMFRKEDIDPVSFYQGKKLRVFGLIKEYKGKPEIIVSNPWQIEVLE